MRPELVRQLDLLGSLDLAEVPTDRLEVLLRKIITANQGVKQQARAYFALPVQNPRQLARLTETARRLGSICAKLQEEIDRRLRQEELEDIKLALDKLIESGKIIRVGEGEKATYYAHPEHNDETTN